ncbi:uncharacterized protein LOC110105990 [Dendrobium catenatum]|uniref:uncharacterized protein LOC110105990 n=1 Tax=Dendrobium catenatum TaxID=906689 RepID=UPI0010A05AB1|nr:uncharacterized protein LOC110105990 [Dendrobium catenatum]
MVVGRVADPGFLVDAFKSRSFAEALSSVSSNASFPDLRATIVRGLPALWISEDKIDALAKPFQFALVGSFPTKQPSLDSIRKFFFSLKLNSEFSVTVLDQMHVLIKLSNELDYSRVFCHRSYLVFNCFMKLSKWSHLLDVGFDTPVIPIWISLPKLRPHLFTPRILHVVGSLFGRPLKVDSATFVGSRPSVARVLVELDITKNFPSHIWLRPENSGYIQQVQFEAFPDFCVSCKCLGHLRGVCSSSSLVVSPPTTSVPVSNAVNEPLSMEGCELVAPVSVAMDPNPITLGVVDPEGSRSLDATSVLVLESSI